MDEIKKSVADLAGLVAEMQNEIIIAEQKCIFTYPRAKAIRRAAQNMRNTAAELRKIASAAVEKVERG